ncbi:MAG: DUF5683 domain-containing protein [Bacteroidales bacterium]|nr:DUF5683 domain-containing protein [Bacteroidales bacterium]MDY0254259.1 DUF5683 domain-containing protein [Tenuifilaceae bacterium]
MRVFSHIERIFTKKGHHLMIALLLFFVSPQGHAAEPSRLDSLSNAKVWLASQVLPGSGQVINRQYWKIPIFYSGMGSMVYLGLQANDKYHATLNEYNQPFYSPQEKYRFEEQWTQQKIQRNLYYAGAAAFYIASVADALIVRNKEKHSPLTASVLSALLPGMGQVYNQNPWKLPFVYGGIASIYYVVDFNQRGYKRFGTALLEYPNNEFGQTRSESDLIYLRNGYRRNRDLAIIGMAGFYLLNIIDAYVDAHFFDWDISDDLAFNFEPMIFNNAMAKKPSQNLTVGLRLNLNF